YLSYSRFADVINNKKSFNEAFSPSLNIGVNKSKQFKYDLSIGNTVSYNSNKTSQSAKLLQYFTNDLNVNATIYVKKVWSLINDYNYTFQQKTFSTDNNINIHIWNITLQRTFKSNEFTAYFTVRDLLNQNIGISRSFSGNTYREVNNDRLKRYFMIGFTWNFKNKAAGAK
ncbi:MAG: hypothetical protein ABI208_08185, partial [Ginsengibacter sp.]